MLLKLVVLIIALQLPVAFQTGEQSEPEDKPVETKSVKKDTPVSEQAAGQRNPNIQVNLIDNNAQNDKMGREGAPIAPLHEFTAVNADYAAEFGGLGRNLAVAKPDTKANFHGQFYDMFQNNVFKDRKSTRLNS